MFYYKNTKINVVKDDITEQKVDAIVNAANNTLLGGGGVDGAIHKKGGRLILEQCKKLGGCATGEAKITTAGDLPCKYVIHTVGPIFDENNQDVQNQLYNAYYNSLRLAVKYNIQSISFPSISTGVYRYPINKAVIIVLSVVKDFIDNNDSINEINFVLFNDVDYKTYIDYIKKASIEALLM